VVTAPATSPASWLTVGTAKASGASSVLEQEPSPTARTPWDGRRPSTSMPRSKRVAIERGVDIHADTTTKLTVKGRSSPDFTPENTPEGGVVTVNFQKRGSTLFARSIDASPVIDDSFEKLLALARQAQNTRSQPPVIDASKAARELKRAVALAKAHPDAWLFIDSDGFGILRGSVGSVGAWTLFATNGDVRYQFGVIYYESVSGVYVSARVRALVDRYSALAFRWQVHGSGT